MSCGISVSVEQGKGGRMKFMTADVSCRKGMA